MGQAGRCVRACVCAGVGGGGAVAACDLATPHLPPPTALGPCIRLGPHGLDAIRSLTCRHKYPSRPAGLKGTTSVPKPPNQRQAARAEGASGTALRHPSRLPVTEPVAPAHVSALHTQAHVSRVKCIPGAPLGAWVFWATLRLQQRRRHRMERHSTSAAAHPAAASTAMLICINPSHEADTSVTPSTSNYSHTKGSPIARCFNNWDG